MFPQTHKIISEHLHQSILGILGIELNKQSIIYGSIKPDITPSLARLDHFKPQTFNLIMNEIHKLSHYPLSINNESIKYFSTQIGIVTHFIADFFCVPHNDRVKYRKATIINHMIYENNLHRLFKQYNGNFKDNLIITKNHFNVDNYSAHIIKSVIDELHDDYSKRTESLENDLMSSLQATSVVGLYIVQHALNNNNFKVA